MAREIRSLRHRPTFAVAAVSALLIGLLVLSSTASATTPLNVRRAYFRVSVEGVQRTDWTANHRASGCNDSFYYGKGSERVRFYSTRSIRVMAFQLNKGRVYFTVGTVPAALPTRGWVERTGSLKSGTLPQCPAVGDGGGGSAPEPRSDCGRKTIRSLPLVLSYDVLRPNRITLSNRDMITSPVFKHCMAMGDAWPTFLSKDERHRTAGEDLSPNLLFNGRWGKMLVLGRGIVHSSYGGIVTSTRINWTLTLVRVKGPR